MEKQGEIRQGLTPPEKKPKAGEKQASTQQLEQHVTKRLAEGVAKSGKPKDEPK